jgi:hypothetical protein
LNYAKQRRKIKKYSEVIEILEHAEDVLDTSIQEHIKDKSEKLINDGDKLIKNVPKDHKDFSKLDDQLKQVKIEFEKKDFNNSIKLANEFMDKYNSIEIEDQIEIEPETEKEIDEEPKTSTGIEPQEPRIDSLESEPESTLESSNDIQETVLEHEKTDKEQETEISSKKIPEILNEDDVSTPDLDEIVKEKDDQMDPEQDLDEIVVGEELESIDESEIPIETESSDLGDLHQVANNDSEEIVEVVEDDPLTKTRLEDATENSDNNISSGEFEEDQVEDIEESRPKKIEPAPLTSPISHNSSSSPDQYEENSNEVFEGVPEQEFEESTLEKITQNNNKNRTYPFEPAKSKDLLKEAFGFKGRISPMIQNGRRTNKRLPNRSSGQRNNNHNPKYSINGRDNVLAFQKPFMQNVQDIRETDGSFENNLDDSDLTNKSSPQENEQPQNRYTLYELQDDETFEEDLRPIRPDELPQRFQKEAQDDMFIEKHPPVRSRGMTSGQSQRKPKMSRGRSSRNGFPKPNRDDFRADPMLERYDINGLGSATKVEPDDQYETRMDTLKKEALKSLQEIQAIISETYYFGAQIDELERISEDARNAFDDRDFQEVLLYVDKCEEISRRLKVGYMDSLIAEMKYAGDNTEYLEYLFHETENAYNEEKYKIGDELARKFINVLKDFQIEERTSTHSWIYCRFCGNSIPSDSTFCSFCGEKLF